MSELSDRIADELFHNGQGEEARRLVLMLPDGRNGGGWGKDPVSDIIERHTKPLEDRLRTYEMRDDKGLADSAAHAIREVLEAAGVPVAAFIEDHVRNLVIERNQAREELAKAVNNNLCYSIMLNDARDLLERVYDEIRHICTDSFDVNHLVERVSTEIAEFLGIDPEGEE